MWTHPFTAFAMLALVTSLAAPPTSVAEESQVSVALRDEVAVLTDRVARDRAQPASEAVAQIVDAIDAGLVHNCVILSGGTLACFGWNEDGQAFPASGTFTRVSAGGLHTCAIRTGGTLACWGLDDVGQANPPSGTFIAVSAGTLHTCGIRSSGALACWGLDDQGQASPPSGTFTAVSAGYLHSCAIRTNGTLACWGVLDPSPAGTFKALSVGRSHSCAIKTDGTLACWGDNGDGKATPPAGTFTAVASGDFHSCAIRTDGAIACWGSNYRGQVTPPAGTFTAVSAGGGHTCALNTDGTLPCWGDNDYGQLAAIVLIPAAVAFGDVVVGEAASPETVTLANLGPVPASVSGVSIVGAQAADFSVVAQTCTTSPVEPTASCEVTLGSTPTALGSRTATLTITGPPPTDTRTVPLEVTGTLPNSGVTWGTRYKAGPAYTWNYGSALGRTVQSGTQRMHLAYTTPRIGDRWARDAGPYQGVYYVRSTSGSTWSTPKRMNPTTQHADRAGLAAAGSRVYVTWVRQTKVIRYSRTAPRVLYVRVNTGHGASTKWKSAVRLTSTSGRVDFPTIAASGYDVYVAYTDANTGSVKVAASHDRGATWVKTVLGTTTVSTSEGMAGWPSVAVDGSTVAVAWVADNTGLVSVATSVDRGTTWGAPESVGSDSTGDFSIAVRGTRIAVVWTTWDDVVVRQRVDGTWEEPVVVAVLDPAEGRHPLSPAVMLQDPNRVAVAWALDGAIRDAAYDTSDLLWTESANGGASWFATQTVAAAVSSSARRSNDWPSVLWPSAGTRYVIWNGWTEESSNFRLYLRKGSGTPVGPAVAAVVWKPSAETSAPVLRRPHGASPAGEDPTAGPWVAGPPGP